MKSATPGQANTYRKPIIIALILHAIILCLVFVSFEFTSIMQPAIHSEQNGAIQAVAVNQQKLDNTIKKLKLNASRKKQQELAHQKKLAELAKAAKEAREKEEQRIAELKAQQLKEKQKLIAEQKAEARKLAELKQQQLVEKQHLARIEKEQQDKLKQQALDKKLAAEKQKKLAEQKKAAQAKKLKQDAERDLLKQLDEDEQQLAAAKSQAIENTVSRYMALIKTTVEGHWNKPDASDPNMHCKLRVRLIPEGTVVSVSVYSSSGDPALDKSAITAVYKSQPLPVPDDADIFEEYFRSFIITA